MPSSLMYGDDKKENNSQNIENVLPFTVHFSARDAVVSTRGRGNDDAVNVRGGSAGASFLALAYNAATASGRRMSGRSCFHRSNDHSTPSSASFQTVHQLACNRSR